MEKKDLWKINKRSGLDKAERGRSKRQIFQNLINKEDNYLAWKSAKRNLEAMYN